MKKINFINGGTLVKMIHGQKIIYKGAMYWASPDCNKDGTLDLNNGDIYRISKDELILGAVNGILYGRVIDGVPYRV